MLHSHAVNLAIFKSSAIFPHFFIPEINQPIMRYKRQHVNRLPFATKFRFSVLRRKKELLIIYLPLNLNIQEEIQIKEMLDHEDRLTIYNENKEHIVSLIAATPIL